MFFFFFNDTATTEIYTLSLHDALPISGLPRRRAHRPLRSPGRDLSEAGDVRSEEHTSELQSRSDLVCRLLLEKKKSTLYSCPTASCISMYVTNARNSHITATGSSTYYV